MSEIPEVDAVVGIGSNSDICEVCEKVCGGEEDIKTFGEKTCLPLDGKRMLTTPSYYAYIKIGEGAQTTAPIVQYRQFAENTEAARRRAFWKRLKRL